MEKNPTQPIYKAKDGVIRFKINKIVRLLLDVGPIDMNKLACMDFSNDDRMQFAQLIGYSVSGFGELSYCDEETINEADRIADIINEN